MTSSARHRRNESGFSLVEMLVVLLIIGLVSSAVLLTAGPSRPGLTEEADRFAAKLAEARDLALVQNRHVLVEVTPDGYALRQRFAGRWSEPGRDDARSWETGASIEAGGARLPLGIVFDPMGLSEAFNLTIYRDGASETVVLDGAGGVRRQGGRHG